MIANCKSYDRRLLTQTRYCYRYASHQPLPYPNKAEQSPDALIPQESSKRVLAPGSVPMGSSCSSSRSEGDGGVPLVNSSQGDGVVPRVISSQASAPAMTCVVKGDPVAKKLLDCPFCQRALLTMAVKGIPYDMEFIDFADKPQWLLDVSGGKVPVLKVPSENLVMPDSDAICSYLEDKFPEPSMKSDVPADITAKIWSAGLAMLKEPDAEVAIELQAAFEAELEKSNAYLAEQPGPLFGGEMINETDAAYAPKLYHFMIAIPHFMNYSVDTVKYPALGKYFAFISTLEPWKSTDYGADAIIAKWVGVGAVMRK